MAEARLDLEAEREFEVSGVGSAGFGVAKGEEVDFVPGENESSVGGYEAENARLLFPFGEADAGVKNGELDEGVEVVLAGWAGEGDDDVGDTRNFGGKGDRAVGKGG